MLPTNLSPADHIRLVHPPGRVGRITLAFAIGGAWQERSKRIPAAIAVAEGMTGQDDVYLSMQSFRGRRANARLFQLGSLYVDVDYYKADRWCDMPPEVVAQEILRHLSEWRIPPPSYIASSGRGLQIVWLFNPLPAKAQPRWQAVEQRLRESLASFGADPAAVDPARVLRIVGTRNSKSGQPVRMIHLSAACRADLRWDFEDLARDILPAARPDQASRRKREQKSQRRRCGNGAYTAGSYHRAVRSDLEKLRAFRGLQVLPAGGRDAWLFPEAISLAWTVPASALPGEVEHICATTAGWSAGASRSRMSAVVNRARQAAMAGRPKGAGAGPDPRYRIRPATIIQLLSITEDEMRAANLRVLVTPVIARIRTAERQRDLRRRRGQVTRDTYIDAAARRCNEARALREAGHPWKLIAERAGFPSPDAARMAVTRAMVQSAPNKSVTVHGGVARPMGDASASMLPDRQDAGAGDPRSTGWPAPPSPRRAAPVQAIGRQALRDEKFAVSRLQSPTSGDGKTSSAGAAFDDSAGLAASRQICAAQAAPPAVSSAKTGLPADRIRGDHRGSLGLRSATWWISMLPDAMQQNE